MKRTRLIVAGLAALSMTTVLAAAPVDGRQIRSKSFEPPATQFDRTAHLQSMVNLQERLHMKRIALADTVALDVRVNPIERELIRNGDAMQQKMRVGIVQELFVPMSFSRHRFSAQNAMLHDAFGAVRGNRDGSFDWAGVVRSPEAAAVRIHFTDFDLPAGAELFVYADNGMAFGPYTGKGPNGNGDFWTNTISGPEVRVQMHASVSGTPQFTIAGVGHITGEFKLAESLAPRKSAMAKACSFNANCVEQASCASTHGAVATAEQAVAHMLFASGRYLYICSGGLIADSDTGSTIPYFITANHCISKSGEAGSLETFFNYTASCGSCPDPGASTTTGASIVSTNRTSDYTLMQLSQTPSGVAYLGWNADAVANSNGEKLYRISHPQGAPQSYSEHVVDTSKGTCQSWPRGSWIYSRDVLGATEGGSSGSPVVNESGELVGQLSGGCGYNVSDECDSESNATVDGAFAAYYPAVAGILGAGDGGGGGGGGECIDADGDGYCAAEDCNDNDRNINPGMNDSKGKWARNGVDNDCNGVIDG